MRSRLTTLTWYDSTSSTKPSICLKKSTFLFFVSLRKWASGLSVSPIPTFGSLTVFPFHGEVEKFGVKKINFFPHRFSVVSLLSEIKRVKISPVLYVIQNS